MACVQACAIISGESTPEGAVQIDTLRGSTPPERNTQIIPIRLEDLRRAQSNTDINRLRILKITMAANEAASQDPIPQYRIFDVREDSVGELLGIENADVLVAANGYIVYHPDQFMRYLASLPISTGTFIEIRREGRPLLLKYEFAGNDPRVKKEEGGEGLSEKSKEVEHKEKAIEASSDSQISEKTIVEKSATPDVGGIPVLNKEIKDEVPVVSAKPTPKQAKSPTPLAKKATKSKTKTSNKSKSKKKLK